MQTPSSPSSPSFPSSSRGKSCSRSQVAAFGSISAWAKSRANAWISRWSSPSVNSIARTIVVPGLASGTAQATLPWSWYSDPDVLRLEQERIFRRAWHYAGPLERGAGPGGRLPASGGDVPGAVGRGRDGELRAFLNVCRHRGAVLLDGEGSRETVQSPYHAWTYDLDGRLRAAPRSQREPGFDVDGIRLVELSLATFGPLVFVNPDPDAQPLEEALGPVPGHFAAAGIDVDALRPRRRTESEVACNWKIAVENYLECYHCQVAHPGFSAVVDVSPDSYRLETAAQTSSQVRPPRPGHQAAAGAGERQVHWLWPVTKLYALPGPPNLVAGPVAPVGTERTAGFFDYFFADGVDDV